MKKIRLFTAVFFAFLLFQSHKTDEGMFLLSDLKNINLKKVGLKIKPIELYNPKGVSLVDAIVRVGGCTGSFVSNEGLIVTNHHCAFSFVAAISDTINNYISKGFLAKNKADERQAKGLVCKITASYEDVSSKVLNGTQIISNSVDRLKLISENSRKIVEEENKNNAGLSCEISEMFVGRNYTLFRYKLLKDVRIVYVPARSIGEYGGELDNWVWPRHSGDFAFLRAYVSPDGTAAEFSMNNVPYKPAKFLKINKAGVSENDFVFVLGYPGRTFRHRPAGFFKYHEQYMLKYVSNLFDWEINEMEKIGKENKFLEIKYASQIKSLANTAKNYKGKLQGFKRVGLTAKKFEEENQLESFIKSKPELNEKYAAVIPRINTLYDEITKFAPRNLWFDYIYSVAPILATAATIDNFKVAFQNLKTEEEKSDFKKRNQKKLKETLYAFKAKYDLTFERAVVKKMFEDALKFNSENKIKEVEIFSEGLNESDISRKIDAMYSLTLFKSPDEIDILIDTDWNKLFSMNDLLLYFASQLNKELNFYDDEDRKREGELNLLMAKYADAKSVFMQTNFVPDANSTLRFTYGYVKGYSPNDAIYNNAFTTLGGMIEKEDGKDYELLDIVKELYLARDFSTLIHPKLNDLPVDLLYNLDTTGGNSGSPVMNSKGELIGVNFDRAYTATINDYAWNESYSRSVGVDIRFVLWVLKKVAKADSIINELKVEL